MQKSRFWNVKSLLPLFGGIIFIKSVWFYVVKSIKVVAWFWTAAQWLFAYTATLGTVVVACIFASMLWFVLMCSLRPVSLR